MADIQLYDNWNIVKKHGARGQLLHGVLLGQDFEIVSPAVYGALYMWYGGGPRISLPQVEPLR